MAPTEDDCRISQLVLACSDLKNILKASAKLEEGLEYMDKKLSLIDQNVSAASRRITPLQTQAMANKALDTRINRAVSPALALLDNFKLLESYQCEILQLSSELSAEKLPQKRLEKLIDYVDCVEKLNGAVNSIGQKGEPVIQKLQEVVEFLSRTKATDQYRIHRLRETLITLKALYETEIDAMRFEGLLDEALLNLQDEYERILLQLKHQNIMESQSDEEEADFSNSSLGSELEIQVLRRISETLNANDCLDICIDIFVKVRYRRAAKALMRLNPDYLKTYTPEEIDKLEWENLETAITLWIKHFELAAKSVIESEKKLCNQVLGIIMDGLVWQECFTKIADKIMAVFFRFGEGVARSSKEPQKLFKLLDMFDSLEKLNPKFAQIFEGEAGADICTRFRELQKLLIHASTKVFWEFGLQIEGDSDGFPPPKDGSVPKLVRYAINYFKYLASENYSASMAKVLRTEQIWKAGILSKPETNENLLKDAISNIIEALQRNVESKKSRYKDEILPYIFSMNTYWYIYMRTRNTELGKLLGEQYMRKTYKIAAEESAYTYQNLAWGSSVMILGEEEEPKRQSKEAIGGLVKAKMETFLNSLNDVSQRHRVVYSIPDPDLREQMKEATLKLVVPVYSEFLNRNSVFLGKSHVGPQTVQKLVGQAFVDDDKEVFRKSKPSDSNNRAAGVNSGSVESDEGFPQVRYNKRDL